ncbi:MAG: hypothetical protein NWE78_01850, partial [Candidatus Bathyarchaeota archaeon]|nr:hypothetical protein [Candidatus Bathyarchaeota archaeon]
MEDKINEAPRWIVTVEQVNDMDEAKPEVSKILGRLAEVLDVLSKISEDLQDISKSLRNVGEPRTQVSVTPQLGTPSTVSVASRPQPVGRGVEDIRMMFSKELEELLTFEDAGGFIKVKPRQYLGSDNFAKIASTIREAGGEYVSAGRDSHFRIP